MALEQMAPENPSQMLHHIQVFITKALVFITAILVIINRLLVVMYVASTWRLADAI